MEKKTKQALLKRLADGLEKLSIGALLLGIFQFNYYAFSLGMIFFLISMGLTYFLEEYE